MLFRSESARERKGLSGACDVRRGAGYGFFLRHVNGIEMSGIDAGYMKEDSRPPFVLNDVKDAEFNDVRAQHAAGAPEFALKEECGGLQRVSLA